MVVEARFAEQLAAASADYQKRFGRFFALVRENTSYDLAFLAFRLDFNEHYERRMREPPALDAEPAGVGDEP